MELVILLFLSIVCATIYVHFRADKKFLVGMEKEETLEKMDLINNRVLELMNEVSSNIKDYKLKIIVKDGRVSVVTTETELAERSKILNADNIHYTLSTYQKGLSIKKAKVIAFFYSFVCAFFFLFLLYLLSMEY